MPPMPEQKILMRKAYRLIDVRYNDIAPIPKQMTIVVGLCVVGLMAFGLALSYYKNILFDRQLEIMQQRNRSLRDAVVEGYQELRYLQSTLYKDKYAKENFGLLRAGEKVLFVSKPTEPVLLGVRELTSEERQAVYEENLRNIRVVDQWRLYIFEHDRIDALKKVL